MIVDEVKSGNTRRSIISITSRHDFQIKMNIEFAFHIFAVARITQATQIRQYIQRRGIRNYKLLFKLTRLRLVHAVNNFKRMIKLVKLNKRL